MEILAIDFPADTQFMFNIADLGALWGIAGEAVSVKFQLIVTLIDTERIAVKEWITANYSRPLSGKRTPSVVLVKVCCFQ